jgi:hypothetical protein
MVNIGVVEMQRKELLVGLCLTVLLIGTVGYMIAQQSEINRLNLEIEELLPFSDNEKEWGATIYFTVYRSGVVIAEEAHHNVITNAGRTALRGHIGDTPVAVWDYIAIGTGSGGDASSTTLVTEAFRAQGTYATVGSYNFTITYEWTAGTFSGETITECGVLNSNSGGTLLNYDDSFSRTLQSTDSLEVVVNFQVGS